MSAIMTMACVLKYQWNEVLSLATITEVFASAGIGIRRSARDLGLRVVGSSYERRPAGIGVRCIALMPETPATPRLFRLFGISGTTHGDIQYPPPAMIFSSDWRLRLGIVRGDIAGVGLALCLNGHRHPWVWNHYPDTEIFLARKKLGWA